MGLQYLAEGMRWDERSLMISPDEQVEQLLRNAATIGVDLRPGIEQGLVRLIYEPPQEIEVDVHFYQIAQIVQEFNPTV